MPIDLSKILTISARDWCDMHGKSLTDYDEKGVHFECAEDLKREIIKNFSKLVPDDAEIVVGYIPYAGGQGHQYGPELLFGASGTALIPKVSGDSYKEEREFRNLPEELEKDTQ